MFYRTINDQTRIALSVPQYAEELFALTDKDRTMLRKWLPWLDRTTEAENTRSFLIEQLKLFADSKALHATIFHNDSIAGVVGFNTIDSSNKAGHIGYWLGAAFQGKGIMTSCVNELMAIGQASFSLDRFEIRCALENTKSRAIPERLGFENEGTIRHAERVNENWYDHVVYGKLTHP